MTGWAQNKTHSKHQKACGRTWIIELLVDKLLISFIVLFRDSSAWLPGNSDSCWATQNAPNWTETTKTLFEELNARLLVFLAKKQRKSHLKDEFQALRKWNVTLLWCIDVLYRCVLTHLHQKTQKQRGEMFLNLMKSQIKISRWGLEVDYLFRWIYISVYITVWMWTLSSSVETFQPTEVSHLFLPHMFFLQIELEMNWRGASARTHTQTRLLLIPGHQAGGGVQPGLARPRCPDTPLTRRWSRQTSEPSASDTHTHTQAHAGPRTHSGTARRCIYGASQPEMAWEQTSVLWAAIWTLVAQLGKHQPRQAVSVTTHFLWRTERAARGWGWVCSNWCVCVCHSKLEIFKIPAFYWNLKVKENSKMLSVDWKFSPIIQSNFAKKVI